MSKIKNSKELRDSIKICLEAGLIFGSIDFNSQYLIENGKIIRNDKYYDGRNDIFFQNIFYFI